MDIKLNDNSQDSEYLWSSNQTQLPHGITYNHGPRTKKDFPFLVIFACTILATFLLGIFSVFRSNPNSSKVSSYSYSPALDSCVLPPAKLLFNTTNRVSGDGFERLDDGGPDPEVEGLYFAKVLLLTVGASLVLSIPSGVMMLLSLKNYAKTMVNFMLPFYVVVTVFMDVYWFARCSFSPTCSVSFPLPYRALLLLFILSIIGLIVRYFVLNWHRVQLSVKIIEVASHALYKNKGLFVVLPCLTVSLLVYYVPIMVFLSFARSNGVVVPLEMDDGEEVSCVWKQDSWVTMYYVLAGLTMSWSASTMLQLKTYVISGTIAQWYFSHDLTEPRSAIRTSLSNAFGPSSGTICLSGLLVFVVGMIRSAVDRCRGVNATGILNALLRCFVGILAATFEFLNKFTINFAAITGEAYISSAKMTYELLKRNFLSTVIVETLSNSILRGIIFVLSAIYGCAVLGVLVIATKIDSSHAYFTALFAFMLMILMLGLFINVLKNAIDTVYICYAIDKDKGEVGKKEVHDIYVQLPSNGNYSSLPTADLNV